MDVVSACWQVGRHLGRLMVDAVLPPLCLGCNEIVATQGSLCAECWSAFSFIAPPHCRRCGVPFTHDVGPDADCADCLARPPRFRRARAALIYDERSRRIVLPFKHGDRTDMTRSCASWMVRAAAGLLPEADLVVPVPLHWRRLFTRRYNQAALLASVVAQQAGLRVVPDLLRRRRWTGSQAGLRGTERRRNVRLAFDLHPRWVGEVRDRGVLLVDDVLTTGATADACIRALQQAGARHVDVLTLARVVRPAL